MAKTVEERVKDVIVKQLGGRAKGLTNESSFIDDFGMDSLEITELVAVIEKEFSVEISDRAIESFKTVGKVIDYLKLSGAR